jgi:NADP-dependent 3-hydroxy acid dehydrogenase YdfG
VGQQRLQELTEEYGQERVIFIQVDVRSYQQFEGDRNLLWRAEKRQDNVYL